jgi:hypothetical protein
VHILIKIVVAGRLTVHILIQIWLQAGPMFIFDLIFSRRLVPGQPKSELEERPQKVMWETALERWAGPWVLYSYVRQQAGAELCHTLNLIMFKYNLRKHFYGADICCIIVSIVYHI